MKELQVTTKEVHWWAPHYNDVKTSGVLPVGTVVSVRDEEFDVYDRQGNAHMYYLLEWEGGAGWTRTYYPNPFSPMWKPAAQVSRPACSRCGGDGKIRCPDPECAVCASDHYCPEATPCDHKP